MLINYINYVYIHFKFITREMRISTNNIFHKENLNSKYFYS